MTVKNASSVSLVWRIWERTLASTLLPADARIQRLPVKSVESLDHYLSTLQKQKHKASSASLATVESLAMWKFLGLDFCKVFCVLDLNLQTHAFFSYKPTKIAPDLHRVLQWVIAGTCPIGADVRTKSAQHDQQRS